MSKKILITGICGFIGSHIAEKLVELGYEVYGVDDMSTGKWNNIEHIKNVTIKIEDLKDFSLTDFGSGFVENLDVICHQAASCNVPKSMKDPEDYFENNVVNTHRLIMEAKEYGIKKVIIASSSAAHDYISPYGMSKKIIEDYSEFYNETYDMNIVNLRYFNVYGPRQSMDSQYSMVIPIFINKLLKGESPTIYGDGNQSRDFIYVDDVVDANVAAIENDFRGKFDVGRGESTRIIDLYHIINNLINVKYGELLYDEMPIFTTKRLGDPLRTKADIPDCKDYILGKYGDNFYKYWMPKTSLNEGLKKTIEWWKNE